MKLTTPIANLLTLALAVAAASACSKPTAPQKSETATATPAAVVPSTAIDEESDDPNAPASAAAELTALQESGVSGTITFTEVAGGVQVEGEVKGLKPNSQHGFHIHENGDCSSPDGKSAGGHFNPMGAEHGGAAAAMSHIGDLGNLQADAEGVAKISVLKQGATLHEGKGNIGGRGLIVHADPDDEKSQPTGNAGGRIACAVIKSK